jgi:hypothetical protein
LDDFLAFVDGARSLKNDDAPTSKIRALYNIAFQGDMEAELNYLYVLSRLEPRHRGPLRKLLEGGNLNGSFWRDLNANRRGTSAADLAELWDFL